MSEWREVRLGEYCDLIAGYAFKSKDFGNYPTKVLKIADINPPFVSSQNSSGVDLSKYDVSKLEKFVVTKGDYVLAMTGATIGKLGRFTSEENAYLNQRVLKFKPHNSIDSNFLYYILCGRLFAKYVINHIDSESAQPNISAGTIGKFSFCLPDLNTQCNISSILTALDDKIAVNRRICENLEAQAQALFKHWFIDFAPFKNGKFVESELGMIPEGWRVGSLFDIAEVHDSKRKPLSGMERAKMKKVYPYYGATEQMDMVDDYIFDGRYVLMGEDGSVVRENGLPYIQYVWGKIWVNNHAHVLTGKNGFTTEMLIPFLTKYNIKGLVTGAVQAKLNQANMAKISLAIPPMSILENISVLFESLYDTYRNCCTEMVTLSTLRDTLLPKLMSGQIKV